MNQQNLITAYATIRNSQISNNGDLLYGSPKAKPAEFFNDAYEFLKLDYPKFFKMDNLCKTGFLAVSALLQNHSLQNYKPEEIGIVFSNNNSSLDTDIRYLESTKTASSPALFVYTLPNILIGELCIRYGIKGESACLVFDIFDADFQARYVNTLMDTGVTKCCISGWADYLNGKFEAFFYLVEKTEGNFIAHNSNNIDKLYQGTWKN